jgi:hypothetical protein
MVQNKKFVAGTAVVAGLVGMGVSGAALALPEVFVGSRLVKDGAVAGAQAAPVDTVTADDSDAVADDDSQSTSN